MDDFDKLISVFDQALTSKDPRVKDALKKFMFIVLMTEGDTAAEMGPLASMQQRMDTMEQRIRELHNLVNSLRNYGGSTTTGTWVYPTYGGSYSGTCTGVTTTTSTTPIFGPNQQVTYEEYKEYTDYMNSLIQDSWQKLEPLTKTDV